MAEDAIAPRTEYVILTRDDSGYWQPAGDGTTVARSAEQAIRSLEKPGTFVAIPERSWKPLKVSAVQQTVLKLEIA